MHALAYIYGRLLRCCYWVSENTSYRKFKAI
jgi:hypothetical protein